LGPWARKAEQACDTGIESVPHGLIGSNAETTVCDCSARWQMTPELIGLRQFATIHHTENKLIRFAE